MNYNKPNHNKITQFNKSACQLQEFPIIKLHIFNHIQILNLSNNSINNLTPLQIHHHTSQHTLSQLRIVDLSQNQLPNVQSLLPLAQSAKNLSVLKISQNPLTQNLNFLYEIVLTFSTLQNIFCGYEININKQVRQKMVKQQITGGRIMSDFLKVIKWKTQSIIFSPNLDEQAMMISRILEELQKSNNLQITEKNHIILSQMDWLIQSISPSISSRNDTFRSPQPASRQAQIEAIQQYQITKQSNQLQRYLTQNDKQVDLIQFYYRQIVQKRSIFAKILQEIQVQESVIEQIQLGHYNAITFDQLYNQINKKWNNNMQLTHKYSPINNFQPFTIQTTHSPLKSIQTDFTSRVAQSNHQIYLQNQEIFFALDRQWTYQTLNFVKHRIISLLKIIERQNLNTNRSPIQRYRFNTSPNINKIHPIQSMNEQNYQTFGASAFQLADYGSKKQDILISPKSKNKYIIGSLVNILQQIIIKMALRRISQTKIIKPQEIFYLEQFIQKPIKRLLQDSIRKIFEAAVFYQCLEAKMQNFKKKAVFKAWKNLKKRKLKLIKSILLRKNKKQKAFLSVFFTQYRIKARNMSLCERINQSKIDILKQSSTIEQLSCILKRSATCSRNLTTIKSINANRMNKGLQFKKTFYKPSILK